MRRISSRTTFYQKRIFPLTFFGALVAFFAALAFTGLSSGRYPPIPVLVIPILMGVIFFFIMKKMLFDLVDEVWDAGDVLIIKNKNEEERVALSDIMNVSYSPLGGGKRVTLLLRRPYSFGDRIHFCPPLSFLSFRGSPIVDDLIQRIDATRRLK
jgi:hypothetical protein